MNYGSRRELTIEVPLAFLLTLAPWGYDQLGLPHNKLAGYIDGAICFVLVLRIFWIIGLTLVAVANITFKEASVLTWWRRLVIRYDVAGMHAYFSQLEIPIPDKIPPLTVHEENPAIFSPPTVYRGELRIPRTQVADRKVVTNIYAAHVIQRALQKSLPGWLTGSGEAAPEALNPHLFFQHAFFATGLREYFHKSYWNYFQEVPPDALILWKIRQSLGRSFADRLASRVLRIAADSPAEISHPDPNVMFARVLKIALSILEAYEQSWPRIQRILDENPIVVEFLRIQLPSSGR